MGLRLGSITFPKVLNFGKDCLRFGLFPGLGKLASLGFCVTQRARRLAASQAVGAAWYGVSWDSDFLIALQ